MYSNHTLSDPPHFRIVRERAQEPGNGAKVVPVLEFQILLVRHPARERHIKPSCQSDGFGGQQIRHRRLHGVRLAQTAHRGGDRRGRPLRSQGARNTRDAVLRAMRRATTDTLTSIIIRSRTLTPADFPRVMPSMSLV